MKLGFVAILIFLGQIASSQDSLFIELMKQNTYEFEIIDGKLIGDGADFLKGHYEESQYVIIGEYHDSPQISNFTSASIPILDKNGFKNIALEVGKHSITDLITRIEANDNKLNEGIAEYHNKYSFRDEDNDRYTAIPFLDFKEDGLFLNEVIQRKWNVFGLDQEYMHSLVPAIDLLYGNLSIQDQQDYIEIKTTVQDSLRSYDRQSVNGISNLFDKIQKDSNFNTFLDMSSKITKNKDYVSEIRESLHIYSLAQLDHKYYEAFIERLKYFKKQLNQQMKVHQFELSSDKMLLKYGGVHTAKGTSKYDCIDIGNTLYELAAFHENKSLHLYFRSRFSKSDKGLEDASVNERCKYVELIKLGKKDKWIAIDLRAARDKSLFYPFAYNLTDEYKRLIVNQDILIIPSMDYEGEPIR